MGFDISLHAEVKFDGVWHHYNHIRVERSYDLFKKLGFTYKHLSDKDIEPIAPLRGLPDDYTFLTKWHSDYEDGFDHSWLNAQEIHDLIYWFINTDVDGKDCGDRWLHGKQNGSFNQFGYVFGNSWMGHTRFPEDRPEGLEDIRWVFWFE